MGDYPGFSVLLSVGRSGGWGIRRDGRALRFHAGWVSLDLIAYDFQRAVGMLVQSLATEQEEA